MIDQSKAVILNDEPVSFKEDVETASTYKLTYTKGNCIVDVFNNLMRGDCDKVKEGYKDFKYTFIPISEELCNEMKLDFKQYKLRKLKDNKFETKYGINPKYLDAIGDTNVSNSFAINIIPHIKYVNPTHVYSLEDARIAMKKGEYQNSYKCYGGIDYKTCKNNSKTAGTIQHEDSSSAWNCLMQSLHNPKYGIIIRQY